LISVMQKPGGSTIVQGYTAMMNTKDWATRNNERGATAIFFAIALVAMIGFGALAVDIGMGLVTRSELQNVSDAAALAGTRELAKYYEKNPGKIMADTAGGLGKIATTAKEYAGYNKGWGLSISLQDSDLKLGKYNDDGTIEATTTAVRALQVTSRRDGEENGTLQTSLATVLGITEMNVRATSAAALTPIGTLKGGQGDFPIGISKTWFDTHKCNDSETIVLFPTSTTSCAGWHTFLEKPASANQLGTVVNGLRTGTFKSPETIAGVTKYEFIGGTVESRCSDLLALFNAKKGTGNKMLANIPVYDFDCGNVTGPRVILGFVQAEINKVICGNNNRQLDLNVKCGIVGTDVGTGGGENDFGLITSSPSMVN
jgi:hypothetical protein